MFRHITMRCSLVSHRAHATTQRCGVDDHGCFAGLQETHEPHQESRLELDAHFASATFVKPLHEQPRHCAHRERQSLHTGKPWAPPRVERTRMLKKPWTMRRRACTHEVWNATNNQDRHLAEEHQRGIFSTADQIDQHAKTLCVRSGHLH